MDPINEIEKQIIVHTVEEPQFIFNYLSADSGHWIGPHRSWIFRGQRDASWNLLPSLFRETTIEKWSEFKGSNKFTYQAFCDREFLLIKRFVKLSDSVGLKIPTDSFYFRTEPLRDYTHFPPHDHVEIWAIAQHHGIPTRFLDFTHSALYAAYFAALSCFREKDADGYLSVWAINIKEYYDAMEGKKKSAQLVSVPTFDNNYLYSQKAVTLYERDLDEKWLGEIPINEIELSLEKAILKDCQMHGIDIRKIMIKINYPKHKAKELLHRLHQNDIHLASLQPTYDSIKESMEIEDQLKFLRM